MVKAERTGGPETTSLETGPVHGGTEAWCTGSSKGGRETLLEGPAIMDPGRAKRDGDLPGPPGGSGEDDRGGGRGFEPTYFF